MEVVIQKGTVRETIHCLFLYYIYIFTPHAAWILISSAALGLVYLLANDPVYLWFAAWGMIMLVLEFPIFCKRYIAYMRKAGAFENESIVKVNENGLTIEQGQNCVTNGYRMYSGYFIFGKNIYILHGRTALIMSFPLSDLPDNGVELIGFLEANKVSRVKFWSIKRWYLSCLLLVVLAVLLYLYIA